MLLAIEIVLLDVDGVCQEHQGQQKRPPALPFQLCRQHNPTDCPPIGTVLCFWVLVCGVFL